MIHFLRGVLAQKTDSKAVIDINGVGFEVWIPLMTYHALPKVGEECMLHTMMIVREDDIRLFGFSTPDERELFRLFLGLQGVGTKMAMDILSHVSQEQLIETIQRNELSILCQVPGVGKKRAEKILFELQRVNNPILHTPINRSAVSEESFVPSTSVAQEAVEALLALGMKLPEAQKAVKAAQSELDDNADISVLIKVALRNR